MSELNPYLSDDYIDSEFHWTKLNVAADDARLRNVAEMAMKHEDDAFVQTTYLYTLVAACKTYDLDPDPESEDLMTLQDLCEFRVNSDYIFELEEGLNG